jgi:3-deoxy-manno-octulosonate cytidylyltransferase (CMP-KDO synthetase)
VSFTAIIPARYQSERLPGKPLLEIAGRPMIQHVYERASASEADRVIVATDNDEIVRAVTEFGGEVCLTSTQHQSGTDRLQEVVEKLSFRDDQLVVNVQGDEPLIPPQAIDQVALNLQHTDSSIATLCERIEIFDELFDPNVVKVVMDSNGLALYFTRAPVPWSRDSFGGDDRNLPGSTPYFRHIGIYAYRCRVLRQFVSWPPSPLERTEKLEQLRAMWYGARIHVAPACVAIPAGVDTDEDLQRARAAFGRSDTGALS